MKELFESKIKLNIKGKNIERFIKRLSDNKINLYNIKIINRKEANIIISKNDYEKVLNVKTIYELNIIDELGLIKIKKKVKSNSLLISFIIVGIICIYILSKIIFTIDIIHTDANMRKFVLKELEKNGITTKQFKKNYGQIQKIKEKILEENKDTIEWIEIENVGTKYIVRLEERKKTIKKEDYEKQNIVSTKSAIIKKIEASDGQIVKEINSYVNKGDIIISGNIYLNEEIKNTVKAEGTVYGEVWYKVKVSYPLFYSETHETGKSKKVLSFNFLNKKIELFPKYKDKNTNTIFEIKNIILPISLKYELQKEVKIIDEVYTIDEAIKKAEEKAVLEMESKLNDKEKILDKKNLKVDINDSKIELEMFFTVYENITGYEKIDEIKMED